MWSVRLVSVVITVRLLRVDRMIDEEVSIRSRLNAGDKLVRVVESERVVCEARCNRRLVEAVIMATISG